MEIDEFWRVVEQAREDAGAMTGPFDDVEVAEALITRLTALPRDEILDFDDLLGEVTGRLDTPAVAIACQLLTGHISDDAFSSFRAGLVGLGRAAVEQIIADPDSLAGHPVVIDIAEGRCERWALDSEDLLFAASSAYTRISDGDEDAFWAAIDDHQGQSRSGDVPQQDGKQDLPRLSKLLPPGRWASEPKSVVTPPPADPDERCPLCGGALPVTSVGSSSRQEDGTMLTRQFRRCLDCSRLVERTIHAHGWDAWRETNPAELAQNITLKILLKLP